MTNVEWIEYPMGVDSTVYELWVDGRMVDFGITAEDAEDALYRAKVPKEYWQLPDDL